MFENPLNITALNDFIFCPASIYFHMLDADTERLSYQDSFQLNGTASHEKSDAGRYSNRSDVLQGVSVYCMKYNLLGKINTFDVESGILTERKRTINTIYDGYVFQLYAQFFALEEMGYNIKELRLYSMTDNKIFKMKTPYDNPQMLYAFEKTIEKINSFKLKDFEQTNLEKCINCIYEPLCPYSI